jgi:GT2 family glycosyltransferase
VTIPIASVVIPTRDRPDYLAVALESVLAQEAGGPFEVLVVDDGSGAVGGHGARVLRAPRSGVNAARNAGIDAASAELVVFIDDDVRAPAGWLEALIRGAARHPEAEALGGPIQARLEGPAPRSCGRELPPITTLDLGPSDREAELAWSANLAVRRSAFDRVGRFDESMAVGGDEQEWILRLRAAGGRLVYVADAALDHRRTGDDARLRSLMRAAYARGRNIRAYDQRRGEAPPLTRELRVLAGCGWHSLRRVCPQGLVMGAHSAGRTAAAVRDR